MKKIHTGFTLIEVIFVLIILGIVSSISSSIIVQVYENYITQNALYKVTTKTELIANQIVNRLTYRIQGTTIAKDPDKSGFIENTDWIMLKNIPKFDNNFTTIEWIGYDNDSLTSQENPGWSGVTDYTTATINSVYTPASHLNNVATIMSNLSGGKVDLSNTNPATVIFSQKTEYYRTGMPYSPTCMGLIDTNDVNCTFRVGHNGDTNLTFVDGKHKIVTERYKLAWSAYALVPEDEAPIGDGLYNLYLYYNYQPWNHEGYRSGTKKLMGRNISVFKFTENGGVIQFKLCASENIGETYNISTCKEKAIIR